MVNVSYYQESVVENVSITKGKKMSGELVGAIIIAAFGSTGLWTVINQIIGSYLEKKKAISENQEEKIKSILKPTNDMVLGLGYDRLVHVCNKHIDKGWIDPGDLADIDKYLYRPYRELGGNGTAEMLFDKVKTLPNNSPEREA